MALKWKNFAMQRKAMQLRNRWKQSETNMDATDASESQSLLISNEETTELSSIEASSSSIISEE